MKYYSYFLSRYNKKELMYIPYGADKGDCPYCLKGVLRRDEAIEKKYDLSEGYICGICKKPFAEVGRRYFHVMDNRTIRFKRSFENEYI